MNAELKYPFQYREYMEYFQCDNLLTFLIQRDILPKPEARFYMAESVLAVNQLHKLNYTQGFKARQHYYWQERVGFPIWEFKNSEIIEVNSYAKLE